jgi:hypothetical protein
MPGVPETGTVPPERVTSPDQLPLDAWEAVDLLDGERVLRCWQAGTAYLLLTNLRCLGIWRPRELFHRAGWETGAQFFFYNLKPPQIVLGRFVELSEEFPDGERTSRFLVRDPEATEQEIAGAIAAGRAEWLQRRERAQLLMNARRHQREAYSAALGAGVPPEVVRVPCAYCGNPMAITAQRCPSCGAPAP